jgi:hypothetical protein
MRGFQWGFWRFAWSRWDDYATEVTYTELGSCRVVTRYRRLCLGLWFATEWNVTTEEER